MISITRRLEFDYGHRVLGHGGKCRHLHGHRGVAEITFQSSTLDNLGMVVDFGLVKEVVGRWINENWDHNLLMNRDDPQLYYLRGSEERAPYVMANGNPTAENMARELLAVATELLPDYAIIGVRIYETPNCFAEVKV